MCFNGPMSGLFAALGLFSAVWVHVKTSNVELAAGIFFFFLMEFLQFIQYYFIASDLGDSKCDEISNKVLTLLGYLHICLQPYFCHVINASLTKNQKYRDIYVVIKRLCLIGGGMLFGRHLLTYWPEYFPSTMDVSNFKSTEWLRGDKLCTFKVRLFSAFALFVLRFLLFLSILLFLFPRASGGM
eukprot:m.542289 g.542289  ORF g.542289 m.542289 type:complete len:185 (+) comp57656_c0_seq20:634-1188(+)